MVVVGGALLFEGKMDSITLQKELVLPLLSQIYRKKLIQHLKPQGCNLSFYFLNFLSNHISSDDKKM
jgi:hypothetical protein